MTGIAPAPRGVPQIEVTFEIDSNGILNVGAEDKGTGKSESITITNDKGRLTEEQIERMIREAEEFAEEDKLVKERVDARNAFDNYLHSMKSAIEGSGDNPGMGDKMDEDEKETVFDAIKDGQDWLSSNPEADAERRRRSRRRSRASAARSSRSTTRAAPAVAATTTTMTMTTRLTTSSERVVEHRFFPFPFPDMACTEHPELRPGGLHIWLWASKRDSTGRLMARRFKPRQ